MVDRTNLKIEEFNYMIDVWCAPKFHLICKRLLKRGRVYMLGAFREAEKAKMMHLADNHRFKMMHLLMKYFKKGTARAISLHI